MKLVARLKWPLIFLAIAVSLNILAAVSLIGVFRGSGTQFTGPGELPVTIKKAGKYTLWHETKTIIDGQILTFADDLPSGTTFKVFKQPEGTSIPLTTAGSSSMESGGTRRVSVGDLVFDSPGEYRIVVTGLNEKRPFYLDEAKFLKMFLTVLVCGFIGVSFFFAAIVSGIYILKTSKRSQ